MRICNYILIGMITLTACNIPNSERKGFSNLKEVIHTGWAEDKLWDDGMAEVATYEAKRIVYGESRSFEYVYVLVKETFNEAYQAKTDDYARGDLYEVMKVNKFCRIPTQAYPYHYLTSLFFKRNRPADLHKLTNTSQEWCGNTAKSFVEYGNSYVFDYFSYWDGQGNGSKNINREPWFEDQLSYTLRTLNFKESLHFKVLMYPTQVTNTAEVPEAVEAQISARKANISELDSAAAKYATDPWQVTITRSDDLELVYWINSSYPNHLLQMEATDGRRLSLKQLERDAYWVKQ